MTVPKKYYLDRLASADDPTFACAPFSFDKLAAQNRFQALAEKIKLTFGDNCHIEDGRSVQDASFYGEIGLPENLRTGREPIVIRISNFENLATIYSHGEKINLDVMGKVVLCFKDCGYEYVPYELLLEPYTGPFALQAHNNWWHRYFDYISPISSFQSSGWA